MFQWEKKAIEWVNRYLIHIATGFVLISAVWIRLGGRNYTGNDFHFSLYDLPGNCNSLLYRTMADLLMRNPDSAIVWLKYVSYAGDFAVAFFALLLLRGRQWKRVELRTFFPLAACLLSPAALLYSVSGMKADSVCMALLLAGLLFLRRDLPVPMAFVTALAACLYPAFWPAAAGLWVYWLAGERNKKRFSPQTWAALLLTGVVLLLSVFLENRYKANGYFFGKLFAINPYTGELYSNPGEWLLGMCGIYGYLFAMTGLLLAMKYRKLRIPALILQLLVIMYVGWQQTSFLAI